MSTVTLSKPHCAITSAEKPDGIASHAFTTALPDAQTSFTLFAIGRVSLFAISRFLIKQFPSFRDTPVGVDPESRRQAMALDSGFALRTPRNDGEKSHAVACWMLRSLTPTSRAVATIAAQLSSGKGTPFWGRSARIFRSGSPGISTASTPAVGLVALMKSAYRVIS